MKLLTSEEMQRADETAIQEYGIPGLELMENAGQGCVAELLATFPRLRNGRAVIVAGSGNNAGDGFVIARLLSELGVHVEVFILASREQISGDAAINLERLESSCLRWCPSRSVSREELENSDVIVDALFGTGLSRDLQGIFADAVETVNSCGVPVLSVDIPSGVNASTGRLMGTAVKASVTVTFAAAKRGHFLYPGFVNTGRLVVHDIGIPESVLAEIPGCCLVEESEVRKLLKTRDPDSHKGSYGHCLVIAGAAGTTGAGAMSAKSAVRSGSGLVSLAVPSSLAPILEIKTTEAMTIPVHDGGAGFFPAHSADAARVLAKRFDSCAIGPGLGTHPSTKQFVKGFVSAAGIPLVIDADALNAIAGCPETLAASPSPALILTPHPGEFSRLSGKPVNDIESDRAAAALDFAVSNRVFIVLKGARTVIAAPDGRLSFNLSGNPGMASGGMGDVLTGVIASLLGQGYDPWDSCRIGVFLHGHAADLLKCDKGESGITATDVQEMLPLTFNRLLNRGRMLCH